MKEPQEDQPLRLRFRKLQEEVDSFTPPFSVPDPRPRRARIHLLRPVPAFAIATAVLAVAIGIGQKGTQSPLSPGFDEVLWRGQTDFLLNTPGRDLLFSVPRVDGARDLDALGLFEDAENQPFE